jgi:release factor glutamine methyltransferase
VTLGDVLKSATAYLDARGVPTPRLDSELVVARALGLTRIELYTHYDLPLTSEERTAVRALLRRRGDREPLAYVLGDWGFRRLVLKTDARALVPRPETEVVVERCLALLDGVARPRVLDVGTGTGAIALALAQERPGAQVVATDASAAALALARENAEANDLAVELVETDLIAGLQGTFDLVVSNPPYVRSDELAQLEPEVRDWEPRAALLDEGQAERLADHARRILDGFIVLEVHEQRAAPIAELLIHLGYIRPRITRDLAGRDRVVEARWQPTRPES